MVWLLTGLLAKPDRVRQTEELGWHSWHVRKGEMYLQGAKCLGVPTLGDRSCQLHINLARQHTELQQRRPQSRLHPAECRRHQLCCVGFTGVGTADVVQALLNGLQRTQQV